MNDDVKLELEKEALWCVFRKIENGVDGNIPGGVGFYLYPGGDVKVVNGKATLKSSTINDDGGFFVFTATYVPK